MSRINPTLRIFLYGFYSSREGYNGECAFDHCAPTDLPPDAEIEFDLQDWPELRRLYDEALQRCAMPEPEPRSDRAGDPADWHTEGLEEYLLLFDLHEDFPHPLKVQHLEAWREEAARRVREHQRRQPAPTGGILPL